jgi:pimeloyl-ACP methyl ester carboxylesterase
MTDAPERRIFTGDEEVPLVADVFGTPKRGFVILAHGGGQTRHAWAKAGQRIGAAGWSAIVLDLRGHGESGWSPSGDYRLTRFARDLALVAKQIGQKPHLVGASLGGLAGLMAETHTDPGAFASLTLVDITPRMEPAGVARVVGFMADRSENGFSNLEEAADVIARYLPHRPRPQDLSGLAKNLRKGEDGRYRWHWDPRFITSVVETRATHSMDEFEARASELRLPLHLIRGRLSELVSEEAAHAFLETAPHAKFSDVADAGHMVAGDRNDAFTEAVLGFLEDQRSAN